MTTGARYKNRRSLKNFVSGKKGKRVFNNWSEEGVSSWIQPFKHSHKMVGIHSMPTVTTFHSGYRWIEPKGTSYYYILNGFTVGKLFVDRRYDKYNKKRN